METLTKRRGLCVQLGSSVGAAEREAAGVGVAVAGGSLLLLLLLLHKVRVRAVPIFGLSPFGCEAPTRRHLGEIFSRVVEQIEFEGPLLDYDEMDV